MISTTTSKEEKPDIATENASTAPVPPATIEGSATTLEEAKGENVVVQESHVNWIPPELRKPEDEFHDLTTIVPLRTEVIDESLDYLTTVEGKGSLPEPGDTIYYKHATRYDNG